MEIVDDNSSINDTKKRSSQKEQVIPIDHESFYEGRVFGELKSSATVHLEDGLLTAKIETPEETYHIEPSWRHDPKADASTMIAYRDSDVIEADNDDLHYESPPLPKTCGYLTSFCINTDDKLLEI